MAKLLIATLALICAACSIRSEDPKADEQQSAVEKACGNGPGIACAEARALEQRQIEAAKRAQKAGLIS